MKILVEATSKLSLSLVCTRGRIIAEQVIREERKSSGRRQCTQGILIRTIRCLVGTEVWRRSQKAAGNKATGINKAPKLEAFTCGGVQFRFDLLGKEAGVTSGSGQFSCSVLSDTLRTHGLQHTRPPCPSPAPGTCSNSCPSSK